MRQSRILGVGSYVPERIWTNKDLMELMDTSDEWIVQRTGIRQRHWVDQDGTTTNSDLGLIAAQRALEASGVQKEEIDLIIYATLSPDHEFPGTGCFFQAKLGLPGVPALDIRQQCTGFIYGLSIADQFIKTGMYNKILLVGSEIHSKGMDRTTKGRDVSVLFGDGAGAVVIGATTSQDEKASRIYSTHLHADGSYAKELWVSHPTLTEPRSRLQKENIDAGDLFAKMNGKSVFIHAVKKMPEVLMEALSKNSLSIEDVDLFVFHQANLRINEAVAKHLHIPSEKVFNTIDRFGNTTAATIPIGLSEACKEGRLKPGMLVASAAFGSGFTWASALFRW